MRNTSILVSTELQLHEQPVRSTPYVTYFVHTIQSSELILART